MTENVNDEWVTRLKATIDEAAKEFGAGKLTEIQRHVLLKDYEAVLNRVVRLRRGVFLHDPRARREDTIASALNETSKYIVVNSDVARLLPCIGVFYNIATVLLVERFNRHDIENLGFMTVITLPRRMK